MIYNYRCSNIQCKERNKEKEINLPMQDAGVTQYCKECKESLQKIYGSPAIKTAGLDKNK